MSITARSTVSAVLDERPEAMGVFLRNRMHCPGCAMASFMTLAEAAASHGLDADALVEDLCAATAERQREGAL